MYSSRHDPMVIQPAAGAGDGRKVLLVSPYNVEGRAWGGISSLQLGLSATWAEARRRGHELSDVVQWMSTAPADRVGPASCGAGVSDRHPDGRGYVVRSRRVSAARFGKAWLGRRDMPRMRSVAMDAAGLL